MSLRTLSTLEKIRVCLRGVKRRVQLKSSRTLTLTLNVLVAVVNSLNTKTHSSKEIIEFCFKNADVKSICHCKQRMKGTLSLSSECVETKLCKPCTSFTSHLHSLCGMLWYRTLRVASETVALRSVVASKRATACGTTRKSDWPRLASLRLPKQFQKLCSSGFSFAEGDSQTPYLYGLPPKTASLA